MTRIAVVQPALALGRGRGEPRAHRGSDPRRPPRARRRGDRRARGVHHAERLREGAARHAAAGRRPAAAAARRAWRASSTACSPAASSRSAARHTYGTFVLAEPDGVAAPARQGHPDRLGAALLPSAATTTGVVQCARARLHRRPDVGLGVGALPHRRARAGAGREARARRHVLALDAAQLARAAALVDARASTRSGARQARALPGQVARLTGVPVAHASHVGPVRGETPLGPGIPWADADARRVADLRPRRHGPRAPDARGRRGPRRRGRRAGGPGAGRSDRGSLLDPRDDADDPRRLAQR